MSGELLVADEGAADREECFVDVGAPVVAAGEAALVVQPGDGAFDHPALGSQAGAVFGGMLGAAALGDPWRDATRPERCAVSAAVVGAVGQQRLGAEAVVRADRRDTVDELEQLGDVVAVPRRQRDRERQPVAAADQVVLAAFARAVDRRGPGLLAPPLARTCELSTTARDQAIWPRSSSSSNSTWCKRLHTPASFHSARRRQQVIPDPQPISCGRSSHEIPVLSTNKIPVNTCRSGIRLRPGYRARRLTTGSSGSIRAHNPSLTRGFAMPRASTQHYITLHSVRASKKLRPD